MCQVGGCKDRVGCARKAERWEKQQKDNLWIGEALLDELRELRRQGKSWIRNTGHEEKRKTDRCISETEIRSLIDRDAWPFEYYKDGKRIEKLGLMGFIRTGGKSYRPIHIILKRAEGRQWNIVTVYDPRTRDFSWSNNYQKRVCFCR